MRVLKQLGAGLIAGVVGGVAGGGLARLFMRLVTLAGGGDPGFSWEGTFFIVLIFVVAMTPVALLSAFTTRWWRWIPGVACAGFLGVVAASTARADLGSLPVESTLQWIGVSIAIGAIFIAIAAAPIVTVRLVDRLLARSPRRSPALSLAT